MPELSEIELRMLALGAAMEAEGPKATTAEVLAAAQEIYDWICGRGVPSGRSH